MSYLSQGVVTVDAILTRKGRELLAKGSFNITQFSLADDDVDYTLFNPNHPSGSAFYGEAILNMPILEAFPDETQMLKYKLVTLPRGTSKLPVIGLGLNAITLQQGASIVITPQTLNYLGSVATVEPSGYVMTIGDARLVSTFTGVGIDTSGLTELDLSVTTGTAVSVNQVGTSFTIVGTTINTLFAPGVTTISTTITVVGRDSGARITIPLTITQNQ